MVKLPKAVQIALAVILVCAVGLAWWGTIERRAYLKATACAEVLAQDYHDYVAWADPIIKAKTAEAEAERQAKLAALSKADAAEASIASIQTALDAERAKTAALPQDALAGAINLRIGASQSWPTGGGVFSFTRIGAEGVLNRFLEGEANANKYEAERSVSSHLRDALSAAERENGNLGLRLSLTQGERDRAVKAWSAETDALNHLRRSIIGRSVKTAAISFGVGVGVAVLAHAVGIIK